MPSMSGLRSSPKPCAIATKLSIASSMICTEKEVKTWREVGADLHEELDRQTAAYNETVKPLDDAIPGPMIASMTCSKR